MSRGKSKNKSCGPLGVYAALTSVGAGLWWLGSQVICEPCVTKQVVNQSYAAQVIGGVMLVATAAHFLYNNQSKNSEENSQTVSTSSQKEKRREKKQTNIIKNSSPSEVTPRSDTDQLEYGVDDGEYEKRQKAEEKANKSNLIKLKSVSVSKSKHHAMGVDSKGSKVAEDPVVCTIGNKKIKKSETYPVRGSSYVRIYLDEKSVGGDLRDIRKRLVDGVPIVGKSENSGLCSCKKIGKNPNHYYKLKALRAGGAGGERVYGRLCGNVVILNHSDNSMSGVGEARANEIFKKIDAKFTALGEGRSK